MCLIRSKEFGLVFFTFIAIINLSSILKHEKYFLIIESLLLPQLQQTCLVHSLKCHDSLCLFEALSALLVGIGSRMKMSCLC